MCSLPWKTCCLISHSPGQRKHKNPTMRHFIIRLIKNHAQACGYFHLPIQQIFTEHQPCTRYCGNTREELFLHNILFWVSRRQNESILCLQPCNDSPVLWEQKPVLPTAYEALYDLGLLPKLPPLSFWPHLPFPTLAPTPQSLTFLLVLQHTKYAPSARPLHKVFHPPPERVPRFPPNSPSLLPSRFCWDYTSMRPI